MTGTAGNRCHMGADWFYEMESTRVPDASEIAVYPGLDVGKGEHHTVAPALALDGKT
jgi:hypothetical protein